MLATIGYETADLDDFVATLRVAKIDILVDVRDRAQSRRRGFSKTALASRLHKAGIEYAHMRQLGDPKPGREAARAGNVALFRRIFGAVMKTDGAKAAIKEIAHLTKTKSVCLMCYERDHSSCHRKIVSDHLETVLGVRARHLGVQAGESSKQQSRRVLHCSQSAAA